MITQSQATAESRAYRLVLAQIRGVEDDTFDAATEVERIFGELDCVSCLYHFTVALAAMLGSIIATAEGNTGELVTQLEKHLADLLDALAQHDRS